MAEVHHFASGWVNPTLAYVMSFLGCLLGLVFATRARGIQGATRIRWLALAAVAIGGTGIWLMHFMAMEGFDVPATVVRYDVPTTMASLVLAVVIVAVGLSTVRHAEPADGTGFNRATLSEPSTGRRVSHIPAQATRAGVGEHAPPQPPDELVGQVTELDKIQLTGRAGVV